MQQPTHVASRGNYRIRHNSGQTFRVRFSEAGTLQTFSIRHDGECLVNSREAFELRKAHPDVIPWIDESIRSFISKCPEARSHARTLG